MFLWSKATCVTDESAYWWQKTSLIEIKLDLFSPQKIKRKIMSLLTDNLWRMRIGKRSVLIIQYKLFTLLFQQALYSPTPTLFCLLRLHLPEVLAGQGCNWAHWNISIHLCLLHSWFNIECIHRSIFFVLVRCYKGKVLRNVENRKAQLQGVGVVWSRVTCVKMQLSKTRGAWSSSVTLYIFTFCIFTHTCVSRTSGG